MNKNLPNSSDINMIISLLFDIFRRDIALSFIAIKQIESELNKYNVSVEQLKKFLANHKNFFIEGNKIGRKRCYEIRSKNDLIKLLSDHKEGIEENNELYQCYPLCEKDIKALKEEKRIRILDNLEEKKKILFGMDEKYDNDADYKEFTSEGTKELKLIWKDLIDPLYLKTEQDYQNRLLGKKIRKGLRKNRAKTIVNSWLTGIIDFKYEFDKFSRLNIE